jgi:hypothetical protein
MRPLITLTWRQHAPNHLSTTYCCGDGRPWYVLFYRGTAGNWSIWCNFDKDLKGVFTLLGEAQEACRRHLENYVCEHINKLVETYEED